MGIGSNKKGTPIHQGASWEMEPVYFFTPKIASLAALATRNFTTRLAAILMDSPVAGLRPMRALRLTSTSLPNPGKVKVFLAFLYARSAICSRISTADFLEMPFFSAISAAICDLDNAFAIIICCRNRK